jgi:hypothetical protein
MDPFRIEGTTGQQIKVNATIKDVTGLFSFSLGASFDPDMVECLDVSEGGFLSGGNLANVLSFPGSIDNVNGIVTPYGWVLKSPANNRTGTGKLVTFTFQMKTNGYSDVHVHGCEPMYLDGITVIVCKIFDYYTAVVDSGTYIVKIVGNGLSSEGGYSAHSVSKVSIVIGPYTYLGQLSFDVTALGENSEAFAYFNVTIPKSMMWSTPIDSWAVQLDGVLKGTRTISENATHTTISLEFTYNIVLPTTQTVKILSTNIVPEFSSMFFAILLVLATFAAALFGKATWSVKRKG